MRTCVAIAIVLSCCCATGYGQLSVLHHFDAGDGGGYYPRGQLAIDPATGMLFGTTQGGGAHGPGVIFRLVPGSGFEKIHDFHYYDADGSRDGAEPYGQPLYDPATGRLYGATRVGGEPGASVSGFGSVWSVLPDGSDFRVLHGFRFDHDPPHSFDGDDGSLPQSMPILVDGMLYGTTIGDGSGSAGGRFGEGTVYRMAADGSTYQRIHNFPVIADDGGSVYGPVTHAAGRLYGMTNTGGIHGDGVLYAMDLNGGSYALLHHFQSGQPTNGAHPNANNVVVTGDTIFGMTQQGGANGSGTLFRCDLDGGNFQILHDFGGSTPLNDAATPTNSLLLNGTNLFGLTINGGIGGPGKGTVFRYDTASGDYEVLHAFDGTDGRDPQIGGLVADPRNDRLYGTTQYGGDNDQGVIFQLQLAEGTLIPEPGAAALLLLGVGATLLRRR